MMITVANDLKSIFPILKKPQEHRRTALAVMLVLTVVFAMHLFADPIAKGLPSRRVKSLHSLLDACAVAFVIVLIIELIELFKSDFFKPVPEAQSSSDAAGTDESPPTVTNVVQRTDTSEEGKTNKTATEQMSHILRKNRSVHDPERAGIVVGVVLVQLMLMLLVAAYKK